MREILWGGFWERFPSFKDRLIEKYLFLPLDMGVPRCDVWHFWSHLESMKDGDLRTQLTHGGGQNKDVERNWVLVQLLN